MIGNRKIRVLVVDDSALVRKIITDILESDPAIEVVGTANNGKSAIFKNSRLNPDVITMDIEMPIMDGLESLRNIIKTGPKPVIMMSVLTQHGAEETFKALEYGAVDFIPKPSSDLSITVDDIKELLIGKVKSVCGSRVKIPSTDDIREGREALERAEEGVKDITLNEKSSKIVGIGTSTGGPSALMNLFKNLPENLPSPVLVVQHMPEGFTSAFAQRLNTNSSLKVKEAEDGEEVLPGCGYIAPGNFHMAVENNRSVRTIRVFAGRKVSGHMPSIDVLFDSMADCCGKDSVAVIMTGMGRDGAEGISRVKKKGGYTIAQNEKTSVIYGMNRVAVEIGAVRDVLSLYDIPKKILEHL
jgi:two-component system chemotaxis response regulator CheB